MFCTSICIIRSTTDKYRVTQELALLSLELESRLASRTSVPSGSALTVLVRAPLSRAEARSFVEARGPEA